MREFNKHMWRLLLADAHITWHAQVTFILWIWMIYLMNMN